jgi:hypothetical protein
MHQQSDVDLPRKRLQAIRMKPKNRIHPESTYFNPFFRTIVELSPKSNPSNPFGDSLPIPCPYPHRNIQKTNDFL